MNDINDPALQAFLAAKGINLGTEFEAFKKTQEEGINTRATAILEELKGNPPLFLKVHEGVANSPELNELLPRQRGAGRPRGTKNGQPREPRQPRQPKADGRGNGWGRSGAPKNPNEAIERIQVLATKPQTEKVLARINKIKAWIAEHSGGQPANVVAGTFKESAAADPHKDNRGQWGRDGTPAGPKAAQKRIDKLLTKPATEGRDRMVKRLQDFIADRRLVGRAEGARKTPSGFGQGFSKGGSRGDASASLQK